MTPVEDEPIHELPQGQDKPRKPKPKIHNRTASYNKISTLNRPSLNRSKSTDGVIRVKRNNKSFTKLANLQPLTKTLSNQSLKLNKSSTSLKNLYGTGGGLKLSVRQGKAILRLNDDNQEYEDLESGDEEEGEVIRQTSPEKKLRDVSLQEVFEEALGKSFDAILDRNLKAQLPKESLEESQVLVEPKDASEQPERFDSEPSEQDLSQVSVVEPVSERSSRVSERSSRVSERSSRVSEQEQTHPEQVKQTEVSPKQPAEALEEDSQASEVPEAPEQSPVPAVEPKSQQSPQESPRAQESGKSPEPKTFDSYQKVESSSSPPEPELKPANYNYNESLPSTGMTPNSNLYGGSLFLSQSTGLVKKIDPKGMMGQPESMNSNDLSGILFKAEPLVPEQSTTNKVVKENSYQPHQSIFNNLQRTNTQYKRQLKQQQLQTRQQDTFNNFSNFLNLNNKNNLDNLSDNRTQQRLWLQRENSLMDLNLDSKQFNLSSLSLNNLMFNHSSVNLNALNTPSTPSIQQPEFENGDGNIDASGSMTNINGLLMLVQSTNSIQSRIEFERLNREYLNVRRYLNPVGESLNRNKPIKGNKKETKKENYNNFNEFSPTFRDKETEISMHLNKMWQEALITTSSIKTTIPPQSPVNMRPQPQRLSSMRNTPMTRAVKVAQAQAAQAAQAQAQKNQH